MKTVSPGFVSNCPPRPARVSRAATTSSPSQPTHVPMNLSPRQAQHAPRLSRLRAGFTLIEILVVIVVIAILATLVAPNIFQHVGAAKSATAKSQIEMLGAALDAYRLDNGRYPSTEQGLDALWEKPTIDPPKNWRAPYLRKPVPLDPWGRAYLYLSPRTGEPAGVRPPDLRRRRQARRRRRGRGHHELEVDTDRARCRPSRIKPSMDPGKRMRGHAQAVSSGALTRTLEERGLLRARRRRIGGRRRRAPPRVPFRPSARSARGDARAWPRCSPSACRSRRR